MEKYFEITNDTDRIFCKLYFSDITRISRVIIFGHGFTGFKDNSSAEKLANILYNKHSDIAVITFDLPGHGEDNNALRLEACDRYLGSVIEYAKSCLGASKLYSYAHSFGGYLSLKYIYEHGNPFVKLAYRSPAVNMYQVITQNILSAELLERVYNGTPVQHGYERKATISSSFLDDLKSADITQYDYSKYSDSIMIIHGTNDELVSFDKAKDFANKNKIHFVPFVGADHRFSDSEKMDTAISNIINFFDM